MPVTSPRLRDAVIKQAAVVADGTRRTRKRIRERCYLNWPNGAGGTELNSFVVIIFPARRQSESAFVRCEPRK